MTSFELTLGRAIDAIAGLPGHRERGDGVIAGRKFERAAAGPSTPMHAVCARHVLEFHLVGDDVAADVLVDFFAQAGVGVDQEMVGETEQVQVGLDAALRIEQEGVATVARRHFLDVVAGDGVQQSRAVASAGHDAAPRVEIQPGSGIAQCEVSLGHSFNVTVSECELAFIGASVTMLVLRKWLVRRNRG